MRSENLLGIPDLPPLAFRVRLGGHSPQTLEGGKGGSSPSYPDPTRVANATTQTNQKTAAYNKALNLNNYSNPFGSQQSYISGYGADGVPIYQTNISANGQLQNDINNNLWAAGNSTNLQNAAQNGVQNAAGQYGTVTGSLNSLGNQTANLNSGLQNLSNGLSTSDWQNAQQNGQQAAYNIQKQYLDNQYGQSQEQLQSQLANQGITQGSQAYNNAMTNFNNQKQQAYSNAANQSILTGSQLGSQNLQNQISGINTQAGLLGQQASNLSSAGGLFSNMGNALGQQASTYSQLGTLSQLPYSSLSSLAALVPGYSGTGTSSANAADVASLYNNQYQSQLAQYNANQASANSTASGLFGLGSAGMLAYALSDRRAKTDIRRIGTWVNGLPVYVYRYLDGAGEHIGFMADDVRKLVPDAVYRMADGLDRVNYSIAANYREA